MSNRRVMISFVTLGLLFIAGCMPEPSAPKEIVGPLDHNKAAQLQSKIRAKHGDKYSIEHQYNGKNFNADWELSNALKRSAQLQVKLPGDWSAEDVVGAFGVVMEAHQSKPWYAKIDSTAKELVREAMEDNIENSATGIAPETTYRVQAKVKKNGDQWFLQIKTQILDEQGLSHGF